MENLRDNILPKKDNTIEFKQKEIDEYVVKILALLKDLKAATAGRAKDSEDLKSQLASEKGHVASLEATIVELKKQAAQSQRETTELKNELASAEEEVLTLKDDNAALAGRAAGLDLDVRYQSDQLQELIFFGPSVYPALPHDYITDIMTWVEQHPEELEKNKEALDKMKDEAAQDWI